MAKFEVGDKVRRLAGAHRGMCKGDVATVIGLIGVDGIRLQGYDGTHSANRFELVATQTPIWNGLAPKDMDEEQKRAFYIARLKGETMYFVGATSRQVLISDTQTTVLALQPSEQSVYYTEGFEPQRIEAGKWYKCVTTDNVTTIRFGTEYGRLTLFGDEQSLKGTVGREVKDFASVTPIEIVEE